MEEERKRIYTVVAIVALVAVVLSCAAGALAGGVTGYLMGQRAKVSHSVSEMPVPLPELEDELPPFEGLPSGRVGAVILEVIAGMAADEAGLRVGDVITAVDQVPVDRNHPLSDVILQYEPGDRIRVTYWRTGGQMSVVVRLTENPDAPGQAYLGVRYQMNIRPRMDLQGG
jgi:S1-C subfamily serine protease